MSLQRSVSGASHWYFAEVTGSNPVEALIFSGYFFPIA